MNIKQTVIDNAAKFDGDGRHLQAALGAYALGELYGWRAVYMCNSQATLRKYDQILGAPLSELCPERTSLSHRSLALRIVDAGTGFWTIIKESKYRKTRPAIGSDKQGALL